MLCYFFRSFDFGFSAPSFFRGDFWKEFFNTGTSFFELRVFISFFYCVFSRFFLVDFFIFFFIESSTFEQFSFEFSANVKSDEWLLYKYFWTVQFRIFCQSQIWKVSETRLLVLHHLLWNISEEMQFLCVLSTLEVLVCILNILWKFQIISSVIELESTSWVFKNIEFWPDEKINFY